MKQDNYHSSRGNRASFCTILVTLPTQTRTRFFGDKDTSKVLLVPVTGGVNNPSKSSATLLVRERHDCYSKGLGAFAQGSDGIGARDLEAVMEVMSSTSGWSNNIYFSG